MDTVYSSGDFGDDDFDNLVTAVTIPAPIKKPRSKPAAAKPAPTTMPEPEEGLGEAICRGEAAENRESNPDEESKTNIGGEAANGVLLIADARERHGAIPHLEAAVENNNYQYKSYSSRAAGAGLIRYEIRTIHAGDYSFLMGGRTVAVAERKTWADLAATISDGRAAGQHENMMRLRREGVHVFYIIEGKFDYDPATIIGNKPFSTLATRLRRDMIRGIPHIQTRNAADTARWLVNYARDLLFVHMPRIEPTPFETALLALCAEHPAEAISQHLTALLAPAASAPAGGGALLPANIFKKHEPSPLAQLEAVWAAIPFISSDTAAAFRHEFTLHDFFNLPHDTVVARTAAMQYAGGGHIGVPRAAKICEIAYRGGDMFRTARAAAAQEKFLTVAIPGITEERARAILRHGGIADIAAGRIPVRTLADSTVGARRLGEKLVERLFAILQTGAAITQAPDPPKRAKAKPAAAAESKVSDEPKPATPKRAKPKFGPTRGKKQPVVASGSFEVSRKV